MRKPAAPKVARASSSLGTPTSSSAAGRNAGPAATAKPRLTPKLRFPEFRDAPGWEEKRLGELFSQREEAGYTDLPLLSVTDKQGVIPQEDSNRRISASSDRSKYLRVVPGDIAYNTMRMWEGRSALVRQEGIISPAYTVCSPRSETDGLFFSYYFKTAQLIEQFARYCQGLVKDTLNLKYESFARILVLSPRAPEQHRIASCLSSLDDLIAAESQKLDTLKTHKKGLMQQLFPGTPTSTSAAERRAGGDGGAPSETRPHLRFPEFRKAGEWEEEKLGGVGDVLMCKRIFASETNDVSGVPFYKIGTLGGKPDAYIAKELFDDYRYRYNYPRVGEILITCSGTVGKCLPYDGRDAYYQDSNIVWIDNPTQAVSNEFLLRILTGVNWGKLNSTTITRIYGPDLKGLLIRFPKDPPEQHRIAACLSSLDDLIAAQSDKLEALKTHKKGLMQQLFPSPEAGEG